MGTAIYPGLADKRVVITGGGSGIGAGLVEAFVEQQAEVHFLDICEDESRALVERLAGHATFHLCDLTDLHALVETFRHIGAVDVLINNAANDDRHTLGDITPDYWDERVAVNLRHVMFSMQAVAPGMKTRGGGAIVNLGSISWHLGQEHLAIYETAKAGIEGMTRAMARELGEDGIRVNCVIPGNVKTPRQSRWYSPEDEQKIIEEQKLKVRIHPHHVASMVTFLASDAAAACTAHNYWVDAGWL
ncbi:SDR family NAD(P)-dependent oxidoreductase [Larsenimonas rhizosphaerae]|uniref:SDR family NAD(P)-dependent oxidoreductase n=1 Tax=Larsenimonas rhizosphaerae TaxID=2944682 RepID=A0AA41ZED1_9GAMM|nr:SDR family oxidoreductase [Larsenimonas rhizosphaerae]MCX2522940.1 SDR family NAD(P)-dependent oxidoreductase [Larsenimonas rhizosphaerae]